MDINKEKEDRKKFKDILVSLSKSQDTLQNESDLNDIFNRLERLYWSQNTDNKFRHYYSDIFSILTTVQQDDTGNMEVLGQNLGIILKNYSPKNKDSSGKLIDISEKIKKLYDHVNLEIARISYTEVTNEKFLTKDEINNLKAIVNNATLKTEETQKKSEVITTKINNLQKEYVTILGIFAAVVLTCVGGIVFSASVLQNIDKASIYRIALVILLIGAVLINVFYFLFSFIYKIINTEKTKNYKLLIITNIVILVLLIIVSISWLSGIVEQRNNSILDNISISTNCESIAE